MGSRLNEFITEPLMIPLRVVAQKGTPTFADRRSANHGLSGLNSTTQT